MGFINEWVSEEDVEKYGLRERNRVSNKGDGSYNWTVDKGRNIYLRRMKTGRGNECTDDNYFDFYWRGYLCFINLGREGGGIYKGPAKVTWILKSFDSDDQLKPMRAEILEDLKLALIAARGGGLYQPTQSIALILRTLNDWESQNDIYISTSTYRINE